MCPGYQKINLKHSIRLANPCRSSNERQEKEERIASCCQEKKKKLLPFCEAHKTKKQKQKAHSDPDDELNQSGEKSGEESETSYSSSTSAAPLRRTLKIREEVADKSRKLEDAEKTIKS